MKLKFWKAIFLLLVFSIFFARGMIFLDPDFGWHLRMGQLILTEGIPQTDPFSYTMPSFPFVDHEWLTSVTIAILYPRTGTFVLAAMAALLSFSSLLLALKRVGLYQFKDKERLLLENSFLLLGAGTIMPLVGIRPQVVSWFLLSILCWVLLSHSVWVKWRLFLPFFFILWANLHGSFALGIFALFFTILLRTIKEKRIDFLDVFVLLASFLATLLNPYKERLWEEVWLVMSDASLRWKIQEWFPAIFSPNFSFLCLFSLSVLLIYRYRRLFKLEEIGLFSAFLMQAILSQRHIPLWVILVLPMVVFGVDKLYEEVKVIKYGSLRFKKMAYFFLIGITVLFIFESSILLYSSTLMRENTFYPANAVYFLRSNLPKGEIFSEYGWGGYLIWQLPGKKVFIDGRMPSWRWKKTPPGESNYGMADYERILEDKDSYKNQFSKYNIDVVLWPRFRISPVLKIFAGRLNLPVSYRQPSKLLENLAKDGWQQVYQDPVAVIYQRPI